jgi:hypothetical protein
LSIRDPNENAKDSAGLDMALRRTRRPVLIFAAMIGPSTGNGSQGPREIIVNLITIWLFNIAMENHHF